MIEFITAIAILCSQPGVGHGNTSSNFDKPLSMSRDIRQEAFAAQTACTKRLFAACTEKHLLSKKLVRKDDSCLVESL